MNQRYDILQTIIPITMKNKEQVSKLPNLSNYYKEGDEIVFRYSVDSDDSLTNCTKEEFKALLWVLANYPTLINEIEFAQLEIRIKQVQTQIRKTIKRLNKILNVVSVSRCSSQ